MSHTTCHQYKLDIKVPLKESFKTKRSKLDLNKGEKVYSSKKLKIHHLGFKSSFNENSDQRCKAFLILWYEEASNIRLQ